MSTKQFLIGVLLLFISLDYGYFGFTSHLAFAILLFVYCGLKSYFDLPLDYLKSILPMVTISTCFFLFVGYSNFLANNRVKGYDQSKLTTYFKFIEIFEKKMENYTLSTNDFRLKISPPDIDLCSKMETNIPNSKGAIRPATLYRYLFKQTPNGKCKNDNKCRGPEYDNYEFTQMICYDKKCKTPCLQVFVLSTLKHLEELIRHLKDNQPPFLIFFRDILGFLTFDYIKNSEKQLKDLNNQIPLTTFDYFEYKYVFESLRNIYSELKRKEFEFAWK